MKLLHLKRTKKKNGLTAFFTIRIIIITDAPALLFLFYLFALSALAYCSEVTVTSISLPPFVSRRGLSNTNQRLPLRLPFEL